MTDGMSVSKDSWLMQSPNVSVYVGQFRKAIRSLCTVTPVYLDIENPAVIMLCDCCKQL